MVTTTAPAPLPTIEGDPKTDRTYFARWLRLMMEERNLGVTALSRMTGKSQTAIRHWLSTNYDCTRPVLEHCPAIADALGVHENEVRVAAGHNPIPEPAGEPTYYPEYAVEAAQLMLAMPRQLHDKAIGILRVLVRHEGE